MSVAAQLERMLLDGAKSGLEEVAENVLRRAKLAAPPTDPEDDPDPGSSLRGDARIDWERGGRVAVIRFPSPHAAKHHEDQRLEHPRGGGPKFLEKAVKAEIPRYEGKLAAGVRANIRRGGRSHRRIG